MTEQDFLKNIKKRIFSITNDRDFEDIALEIFHFQRENNAVYKEFIENLSLEPEQITCIEQIPFLPIEFFKYHKVVSNDRNTDVVFESSGTTGSIRSRHYVQDADLYEESFLNCFRQFYNSPEEYTILALLPSYLEKGNSSLVYMVDALMTHSKSQDSGFYLYDYEKLRDTLKLCEDRNREVLIFGVSYALLEFAEHYSFPLNNTTIIETGGMKGMREELTKEDMYKRLRDAFPGIRIHSEYGMTELLSQAYSQNEAHYRCPRWMKIYIRDLYDPFTLYQNNCKGGINIVDLANIYSCSFIQTQDIGEKRDDFFMISGRIDNADIRGCNLLVV